MSPKIRHDLGPRIRALRVQAGIPQTTAATNAGVHHETWRGWELGRRLPRLDRCPMIAQAVGAPIAALFTEELVLAEVRVSAESLARVKREGAPAASEIAARIAQGLEALLLAEVARPRVAVPKGTRAKRRRTRADVLAATREATMMREARRAKDRLEAEKRGESWPSRIDSEQPGP